MNTGQRSCKEGQKSVSSTCRIGDNRAGLWLLTSNHDGEKFIQCLLNCVISPCLPAQLCPLNQNHLLLVRSYMYDIHCPILEAGVWNNLEEMFLALKRV